MLRVLLTNLLVEHDGFFYGLAEFVEHRAFVAAVTAAENKTWRTADVSLILLGPFDDFDVPTMFFHSIKNQRAAYFTLSKRAS